MFPRTMDFFRGPIGQRRANADVAGFPKIFVHGWSTVSLLQSKVLIQRTDLEGRRA
jgi:hypothetical protein